MPAIEDTESDWDITISESPPPTVGTKKDTTNNKDTSKETKQPEPKIIKPPSASTAPQPSTSAGPKQEAKIKETVPKYSLQQKKEPSPPTAATRTAHRNIPAPLDNDTPAEYAPLYFPPAGGADSPKSTFNDFLFRPKNVGRSEPTNPLPFIASGGGVRNEAFDGDETSLSTVDESLAEPKPRATKKSSKTLDVTTTSEKKEERQVRENEIAINFPVFPEDRPRKMMRDFNSLVGYSCNILSIPLQMLSIMLLHSLRFVLKHIFRVIVVDIPNIFLDQILQPLLVVILTPLFTMVSKFVLGVSSVLNNLFIPFINVIRAFRLVNVEMTSETVNRYRGPLNQ